MSDDLSLQFDQFLRSIEISKNESFNFLLGAGASISSGIQSAYDCIWEWKRDIYFSNNPDAPQWLSNYKLDQVRDVIQNWLDNEGAFLPLDDPREYSFYVEKCYPISDDRRKFFTKICERKEPSLGYKLICSLADEGFVQSVWTTNFDGLTLKAASIKNITAIDITLDSVNRIIRPVNKKELLHIGLHGDYKYGELKNTPSELQEQDSLFRERIIDYFNDKHLIISGYSGRDKSLMSALKETYSKAGSGRLYWCGYGDRISPEVQELISLARANNRTAFYISTDGFDKLLIRVTKTMFKGSVELLTAIDNEVKTIAPEVKRTPFNLKSNHINSIIKSNSFPIEIPKEVFNLSIEYKEGEPIWKTVRELGNKFNVVAVPYRREVWALGTITDITNAFEGRVKDKITRVPLTNIGLHKDSAIYNLLLRSLVKSLAINAKLEHNERDLIWIRDSTIQKTIGGVIYSTHQAIRLSFTSDSRYYLTLVPDFYVSAELGAEVPKMIKQEIGRSYFEKMFNKKFNTYINEWRNRLFNNNSSIFEIEYPVKSQTGLGFKIRRTPAFASIMNVGSNRGIALNEKFPKSVIKYSGIKFNEPKLIFSQKHPSNNGVASDFHPMRGLLKNRPFDFPLNNNLLPLGHDIELGVICPKSNDSDFHSFISKQNQSISSNNVNSDYLLDYEGFYSTYGTSLNIPNIGGDFWESLDDLVEKSSLIESGIKLARIIRDRIEKLTDNNGKLIIVIYIPDRWLHLTKIEEDNHIFDLHDYIKAFCAERNITTQFIQEKTVTSNLYCQIQWWLSLSFYVKAFRTPWILDAIDKSTAFAGIGYSVDKSADKNKIILGCSHIYNSQGEGLKYKLSKIEEELFWDRQKNPHLSYNDAFNFGLSIRNLFFETMKELPKRVVVHKRTYFTEQEIKGIKDSLLGNGIENIDLIEINYASSTKYIASKIDRQTGMPSEADGFPVARGTCIQVSAFSAFLWTHGIVPSVKKDYYKYYLGGRYIPTPLKITKHYGNGSLGIIANEILGLSKMNWNSFDLYSRLPSTISSSNEIAKIGKLLSKRNGIAYDYRCFM